jgi:hypothetical protein
VLLAGGQCVLAGGFYDDAVIDVDAYVFIMAYPVLVRAGSIGIGW